LTCGYRSAPCNDIVNNGFVVAQPSEELAGSLVSGRARASNPVRPGSGKLLGR
jgi:hypothetical protein